MEEKKIDNFAIVGVANNDSSFITNEIPAVWQECEKSFMKSLDVVIKQIKQYVEEKKVFPQGLVLKDHIALGIVIEYMYFFEEEFQKKLTDNGFAGVTVKAQRTCSRHSDVSEKMREIYPDIKSYWIDDLFHAIEKSSKRHFKEPCDKRQNYLIYLFENEGGITEKTN